MDKDKKITQLRKGILELAIMGNLYHRHHYGYSLVRALTENKEIELKEGTIYPILNRLAREGLVTSEWVASHQGPPRKYYSLTDTGKSLYQDLRTEFRELVSLVTDADETRCSQDDNLNDGRIHVREIDE